MRDLNAAYREEPALHVADVRLEGFEWLVVDDSDNSVFAYLRKGEGAPPIVVALNMTPEPRSFYRIGVPHAGFWKEILNTDAACYGGTNTGNLGGAQTREAPAHGHAQSLELVLPPLSAVVLRLDHATEGA